MNIENKINSQDILNAIDLNKINSSGQKKRGRPKKSQQMLNPPVSKININNVSDELEEIILHLPITKLDIQTFRDKGITIADMSEKIKKIQNESDCDSESESESESESTSNHNINSETIEEPKKIKESNNWNDSNHVNQKQYGFIINKLKEENDKLKKYLQDITPMYFTEVKIYPVNLKIFDKHENVLIPKKTNINCWWCTYNFDCLPTFIPFKYTDNLEDSEISIGSTNLSVFPNNTKNKSTNYKFYVFGCFCLFNCAGAYNLNINDNKIWDRYSLLKHMYYMINKDNISSINEIVINIAGPKELLEKYGGPMKIEEYRKNAKILGREYHKLMPPFIPINIGFEETTNSKTTNKSVNINNIISINTKENMLIKRNKPLTHIASKGIDNYID